MRLVTSLSAFIVGCATLAACTTESPVTAPGAPSDPTVRLATGAPGGSLTEIDLGDLLSCAVNRRGDAFCWGNDLSGQLGDGTDGLPFKTTPVAVSGGFRYRSISAGGHHVCGVAAHGAVLCWGAGTSGQLGNGVLADVDVPGPVSSAMTWQSVSAGESHTCGIAAGGAALCWGEGSDGQRGDGTNTANVATPVAVAGALIFSTVSAGVFHTCGVTTSNQGYCWGRGANGQLGDGNAAPSNVPVLVAGGLSFASITVGVAHSCGMTTGGQAYCWGNGLEGELGTGNQPAIQPTPVPVSGALTFDELASGHNHVCGLDRRGSAFCWGQGLNGERGDGTNVLVQASPVAVVGGLRFRHLEAGQFHTCGTTNTAAYCWGDGTVGGLGDGGTAESLVPAMVIYP